MSHTNRLIHETSPYLLQHAHNPVDWHPWGEEALERARREDKPILLSIGYSACHWCHVMEHESFEDEDVARVMNELFINIKVDREERPDLDKIYQTAHQILASRPGGWPLNMFLTPEDHMPFFGGTYFPRTPRYGMPGFTDVLKRVASFYREKRDAVENQNAQVREIFARLQPAPAPGAQLDTALLARAAQQLKRQYDARHGGFGRAPKFPHPTSIELCLRLWARSRAAGGEDHELLGIARHTLRAMALGGIYDQLGGGFCRYSVDDQWMIPHFEKMLYDNGQLLALYADAFAATGEALFGKTAAGIGEWVVREMQSPEGGYCSSLDADSEGHEGKFFVWTAAEIRALLDDEEWRIVSTRYRLGGEPNFEGKFHLHAYLDNESLAAQLGQAREQLEELLASAHRKLLATRGARIAPGRDDKILTSWNALMIKGMARAARRLARTDLLASAERAFDFVRTRLWQDGRLRATAKDGRAHLNAYLDDYAYLIDAGLELLQARWNSEDLTFVCALADTLIEHFEDEQVGGFFFTSDDHERLAYRPKPAADEAVPSGNGIAAHSLARLGHLLGDLNYLHAAERVLEGLRGAIHEHPSSHATLLLALDEQLAPPQTVVIRGEPEEMRAWCAHAAAPYVPWRQGYAIAAQETALPGMLGARAARDGVTTAYVCAGHTCGAPVVSRAQFEATLAAGAATTA